MTRFSIHARIVQIYNTREYLWKLHQGFLFVCFRKAYIAKMKQRSQLIEVQTVNTVSFHFVELRSFANFDVNIVRSVCAVCPNPYKVFLPGAHYI